MAFDCPEELFPKRDPATRLYGYASMTGEWIIRPAFERAYMFQGRTAIIGQGKQFGVVNCQGVIVVPAQYDQILSFVNGSGWGLRGGKWALVNDRGREVVPPTFEAVEESGPRSGQTWVSQQGRWGLFDKTRERMLIPPRYESYVAISDSLAIGQLESHAQALDLMTGGVVIDSVRHFYPVNRTSLGVVTPWGHTWVTRLGRIRATRADTLIGNATHVVVYINGRARLHDWRGKPFPVPEQDSLFLPTGGITRAYLGGKYRYLTLKNGQPLIKPAFRHALDARYGLMLGKVDTVYRLYSAKAPDQPQGSYHRVWGHPSAWLLLDRKGLDVKASGGTTRLEGVRSLTQLDTSRYVWLGMQDGTFRLLHIPSQQMHPLVAQAPGTRPGQPGMFIVSRGREGQQAHLLDGKVVAEGADQITQMPGPNGPTLLARKGREITVHHTDGKALATLPADSATWLERQFYLIRQGNEWSLWDSRAVQRVAGPARRALWQSASPQGPALVAFEGRRSWELFSGQGKPLTTLPAAPILVGRNWVLVSTPEGLRQLQPGGQTGKLVPAAQEVFDLGQEGIALRIEGGGLQIYNDNLTQLPYGPIEQLGMYRGRLIARTPKGWAEVSRQRGGLKPLPRPPQAGQFTPLIPLTRG